MKDNEGHLRIIKYLFDRKQSIEKWEPSTKERQRVESFQVPLNKVYSPLFNF